MLSSLILVALGLGAFAIGWPWFGAFLIMLAIVVGWGGAPGGPEIQPPPITGPPMDDPSE